MTSPSKSRKSNTPLGTIRGGVTIEDVARQAGVSRQTVSNVINAPGRVKPDTTAHVRAVIDSLGYRINRSARNLRTQQSRVIGYCLPPLTVAGNSVLDAFLHALVEAARQHGYHLLLVTAPNKAAEIDLYWELAAQSAVDGVVFAQTDYKDPRPPALVDAHVPFVSFGRTWGSIEHSWVDVDGAAGTQLATEYLLGLGHTRFAWIGHTVRSVGNMERERGVQRALDAAGLGPDALQIVDVDDESTVTQQLDAMLTSAQPPTAIVAVNDVQAVTALAEIERHGLRPGQDVAVVGFDDSPVATFAGGGLSSIKQPLEQVAKELIRVLASQFDDPAAKPEGVLLSPELVVRRSTTRTFPLR